MSQHLFCTLNPDNAQLVLNRRNFIKTGGLLASGVIMDQSGIMPSRSTDVDIACQQYNWHTFYQREGRTWSANINSCLEDVRASGFLELEPSFSKASDVEEMKEPFENNKLKMHSFYVGSTLHIEDQIEKNISDVVDIASVAQTLGTRIIVTNPAPISWTEKIDKTDAQIITQAKALNELGAQLRSKGMILAYHNHDAEMRNSAREFHHMMVGTDPENVKLCLDAHWIYRGSGNSQVALFDIVTNYVDRIVELHLRQSKDGIWTEAFGEGDIDYELLVTFLKLKNNRPYIVLEQCVERESPHTMDGVRAHQIGLAYCKEVFADLL